MASPEYAVDPEKLDFTSRLGSEGSELTPEAVAAVRDAIDKLPRLQRAVINAFFYERLDLEGGVSKLAREHNCSRWYIYQALEKAQATLRRRLAALQPTD